MQCISMEFSTKKFIKEKEFDVSISMMNIFFYKFKLQYESDSQEVEEVF